MTSAEILDFDEHRRIWHTAYAECLKCKHEWAAVYPNGCDTKLECPNCGAQDSMAHDV
jgi:predicted RNA-binding Zn-ribbon protein involved in translation (DUF1610 family)